MRAWKSASPNYVYMELGIEEAQALREIAKQYSRRVRPRAQTRRGLEVALQLMNTTFDGILPPRAVSNALDNPEDDGLTSVSKVSDTVPPAPNAPPAK